ncbi:MAG: DNA-binding helix-turn-helix protein [Candidatus Amesbacteria bacterium GW2011_GWA2_42_12]|uniref:DNA-binding helix-turn-helix protein n=1 Tax=Candidatus Amesbacteria bacterium GW2011_GWA2_42_12 TaxID=1618356 RepID=A0A0G0Y998_9BACT|nr:MAG: DNA-binding helix-turn-helix protein [Candidatus Amesbacteria bacterium GW2011_GWA2_42_12]
MRTVGQILAQGRESRKLTVEDVARVTKIRANFLEAIEADDYQKLPSGAVAKGFIKNYSDYLDMNHEQVLAVFRRDFVEDEQGKIVPRGMVQPVNETSIWNPKTTFIAFLALIFTVFGGYLFYQIRILTGPPPLTLESPKDGIIIHEDTVRVFGSTDPEATLSIDGQLVALEKGGQFEFRIPVQMGENKVTVTAISKYKKTRSITRTVIYSKP